MSYEEAPFPTRLTILLECRKLQSGWSEAEKRRRQGEVYTPWDVPVIPGEKKQAYRHHLDDELAR